MKQINITILTLSFFAMSCNIKGGEKNLRSPQLQKEIENIENYNNYNNYKEWNIRNALNLSSWYNGIKESLASIEVSFLDKKNGPCLKSLNSTIKSYNNKKMEEIESRMDKVEETIKKGARIVGKGIQKGATAIGKQIKKHGPKLQTKLGGTLNIGKKTRNFANNAGQLTINILPNLLLSSVASNLLFSYPDQKIFIPAIFTILIAKDCFDWYSNNIVEETLIIKEFKRIEKFFNKEKNGDAFFKKKTINTNN